MKAQAHVHKEGRVCIDLSVREFRALLMTMGETLYRTDPADLEPEDAESYYICRDELDCLPTLGLELGLNKGFYGAGK